MGEEWDRGRSNRVAEKILAAATRTLNRDARASLADIAREADVGRTTLHRYFPTRAALYAAMTDRALARLETAFDRVDFEQPFPAALSALVTACLPLGPEMVFIGNTGTAWEEGDPSGRFAGLTASLRVAAERAQIRGEVRADVPAWWIAELVMLNLWGAWYIVSGGYVGPRAMPPLIIDTLLRGIAPLTHITGSK
jgi:AcrR family transcriptional regulator